MKIKEDNFIQQLIFKNEKALEYVICEYGWIVKSIIKKHLYLLQSYEEECMNDVFLGIWNNIECFDSQKSSFQNWVAGITRYKSIDYLRKYIRELKDMSWNEITVQKEDNSHIGILEEELSKEVEKMLQCLSPNDQKIFKLLYVEEKDIDQVSDTMGIKKEVIYNRVSRGKKKIRSLFSSQGKENQIHG